MKLSVFGTRSRSFLSFMVGILWTVVLASAGSVNAQQFASSIPQPSTVRQLDFQRQFGAVSLGFARFSQELSVEDPLSEFFEYLLDPINWDLSESIYPRMNILSNVGMVHSWPFLNGANSIRLGIRSRMDQARITTLPVQRGSVLEDGQDQHLVDVMYTPYLALEMAPASWLALKGLVQIDAVHRDLQGICRSSCSVDPGGNQRIVVPGFKARLEIRPMDSRSIFVGLGKGFLQFDDREPAGSVAERQLHQARYAEAGFSVKPNDRLEWGGTVWIVRSPQDFIYVPEDEDFTALGAMKRHGMTLNGQVTPFDNFTFSGTVTYQDGVARAQGESINLPAIWQAETSVQYQWNAKWTTTIQWQYFEGYPDIPGASNQDNTSLNRIDVLAQYETSSGWGTVSGMLGLVNISNSRGSGNRFLFDSGFGNDSPQAIDLTYFPHQPRMVVGGLSMTF